MKRDPLLSPSPRDRLADRPAHSGPWPWRLSSLYVLAFLGTGPAAAAISWWNAERLGLPDEVRQRIATLGAVFLAVSGLLLGGLALHLITLEAVGREALRQWAPHVSGLLQIASVALAWKLVRLQVRADRLYRIESGGSQRYSSLWGPGLVAAIAATALLLALIPLGALIWQVLS